MALTEPILLKGAVPSVDRAKIGISYSGGGPLVVVELGIAQAFVQVGIIPAVIAGVSAGALASVAHALDVHTGKGIEMAADILGTVTNRTLGLDALDVVRRLVREGEHITSLGDNAPIGPAVREGLARTFGLVNSTTHTFAPPRYPKVLIAATDACHETSVWFSDDTPAEAVPIEEVLIASSAIPGVFPWRVMPINGDQISLIDGGVVTNQPLSKLVEQGCGTMYACAVGPTAALPAPNNGLENAYRAATLTMHQCTKLEEDYVRLKIGNQGVVHHIHPIVDFPVHQFDFTPDLVRQVMDDARVKTVDWLGRIQRGEITD
jgi:predicted acylesterase/phospholipase RssA